MAQDSQSLPQLTERIVSQVARVLVGHDESVRLILWALYAGGHILIEDIPGVGKTTLVKTLARVTNCSFGRIQFTPDLVPSDVTGLTVYQQHNGEFVFRRGPVDNQIVLADEINRASPKTQASLLECMQEQQVTVDNQTFELPQPFIVMATQNPVEHAGTFPLPHAQLDRFIIRLRLGYPDMNQEHTILQRFSREEPLDEIEPSAVPEQLLEAQQQIRAVEAASSVIRYLLTVIKRTREHERLELGASPRASLDLYKMAQARAAAAGRRYIKPDDIKALAKPVLAHRLLLKDDLWDNNETPISAILDEILRQTPVPVTPAEQNRD